jgi:protein-disulfide isomerase
MDKNRFPPTVTAAIALLIFGALGFLFYRAIGANDLSDQSAAGNPQFGQQVRAYLLENPTVLREVITKLQVTEQQETQNRQSRMMTELKDEIQNDGYSHVAGNPNGDVTIVEFFDYRCGYCKKVYPDLMKVVEEDGNIRLVLKEFPILGEASVLGAHAVMAAEQQGKYMEFHDELMKLRGNITETRLMALASQLDMDGEKLAADMKSEEITTNIRRTYDLAQALGITGTPAFVIGDNLTPGAIPAEQIKQLVAQARDQAANSATN